MIECMSYLWRTSSPDLLVSMLFTFTISERHKESKNISLWKSVRFYLKVTDTHINYILSLYDIVSLSQYSCVEVYPKLRVGEKCF